MIECKIKNVYNDPSYFRPLNVSFQNGQPHSNQASKLQCLAFTNKNTDEKVIAVATSNLTYVGIDNSDKDLCNTLLTIRNKRTNKVRIVPVNNISLSPVLTKVKLSSSTSEREDTIDSLLKQFGTKRQKRHVEQKERMKMNIKNVEKELLEKVADIKVNPEDLVVPATDDNDKFYRPPMNRDASTVDQVYDLNNIITQQELDTLEELANQVIENPVEDEKYSIFAAEYMKEAKKSVSKDKLQKIEMLLYVDAILKFFKVQFKTIGRKDLTIEPYPQTICKKIQNEFTVFADNRRTRPISMKDKAIFYCIITALLAMDYEINLEPLSRSIGAGVKKLLDASRVLGAQPHCKSKTHIILKLPLAAQPSLIKRKKK